MDQSNTIFQHAFDIVTQTDQNIYLTGRAGTGKTTFLKYVREKCDKTMVVLAPTGIAAINANGQTIHSFFKLSFGPLLITDIRYSPEKIRKQFKYNKQKIELINSLDLLIIDEVSMVRADTLDIVDLVLREYRNNQEPFGGVQVLMIGDVWQLPPVVKREEWDLLGSLYKSPFFFSSNAFKASNSRYFELEKIYRQSDEQFIGLLNNVRSNSLGPDDITQLRKRVGATPKSNTKYITLSTHNNYVDAINEEKLEALESQTFKFKAQISGDFPEHVAPTAKVLELKVGAQVMFLKNDQGSDKLFYNGTIGEVTKLTRSSIEVKTEQQDSIKLEPELWENVRFDWDAEKGELQQEVMGTWKQYPIKLAWAITVHKSQGLTFEHVIAHLGKSFAEGQVYVALSRCTSLEGLILDGEIPESAIKLNPIVSQFTDWMKKMELKKSG